MSTKSLIILIGTGILGWYLAEHLLIKSAGGILYGGPAEKEAANEYMKRVLWGYFFVGMLLSTLKSGRVLSVWENEWSLNSVRGLGAGIGIYYMVKLFGFTAVTLLVLYLSCFGAGSGVGKVSGAILGKFVPEKNIVFPTSIYSYPSRHAVFPFGGIRDRWDQRHSVECKTKRLTGATQVVQCAAFLGSSLSHRSPDKLVGAKSEGCSWARYVRRNWNH